MSWLANNSTKLPALCHFQGSPQQLFLAHLHLREKCLAWRCAPGCGAGPLHGPCRTIATAEDRDVAVFGHEEWQRLHVYSHADCFETRDEVHPILLTLKYRWIKKRRFSLPIYCVYSVERRWEKTFLAISVEGQIDWAIVTELASRRKGHNLHNFPAPQCEDLAHQTTTQSSSRPMINRWKDILLRSLSFQGFQSNIEHVLDVGMRIGHVGLAPSSNHERLWHHDGRSNGQLCMLIGIWSAFCSCVWMCARMSQKAVLHVEQDYAQGLPRLCSYHLRSCDC